MPPKSSISPSGESFPLPVSADFENELKRIETLVTAARRENKEIVVVMGLGVKFQVPSFKLGAYNLKPET